jgi:hypothetical protein
MRAAKKMSMEIITWNRTFNLVNEVKRLQKESVKTS